LSAPNFFNKSLAKFLAFSKSSLLGLPFFAGQKLVED